MSSKPFIVIMVIAVIVIVVNSYFLMVFLVRIQYFFQVLVHFVVIYDIVIVLASDGFQKAQGLVSAGEGVAGRDRGSVVALMGASR